MDECEYPEHAFRLSQPCAQVLFEGLPLGLYCCTSTGELLEVNPALVQLLGYPDRAALLSVALAELFVEDEERQRRLSLWEEEDGVGVSEVCLRRFDGTVIRARITARTCGAADGGVLYGVGCVEELLGHQVPDPAGGATQAQQIREARLAVLEQLSRAVGHELRNPLGVISNAVYYLKLVLEDADPRVEKHLALILEEVQNATAMVSELSDFGRVVMATRGPAALADIVAGALARRPLPEGVHVHTHLPADLPPVNVDARQIEQVIAELVRNAYEAMPKEGALTFSAWLEHDALLLSIADTGCGIAAEHLDQIFEPLFTTKPRRIGLGLARAQRLVAANQGRIGVTSEGEKGTTFTLVLPVKEVFHGT